MHSLKSIIISTLIVGICLFMIYNVYYRYFSITSQLDNYVQTYVDQGLFSGAVLVAREGKILLSKAYGMANLENDLPNRVNTKFRLGSVTKQFTAMAIMQLQEKAKLNVQDPLSKYIPDYPNGDKITIHNLLTHTSGITNLTSFPEYQKKKIKPHTLEQLIVRFKNKPLEFNPGEKYKYSNSNYILLTYIIEKSSDKKYETFLKEHIFDPLNMKDTGCDDSRQIIRNRASGYSTMQDKFVNAAYIDMSFPAGAGALYSTVGDLYLWDQALYLDKLISKESLAKIFTPFKDNYGYGLVIGESPHGNTVGHGGAIDGFVTTISRHVDLNVCVIVLSNFDHAPVGKIMKNLEAIVFGQKPEYPKKHVAIVINPKIYDQYVGTYKAKEKDLTFDVTKERNKLFIELVEQKDKREVYPESETEFFFKFLDAQFSFIKDKDGKVTKLILHQDGDELVSEKVEQ